MGLTAVAECKCGQGKIVGYGSVYGVTPYKHYQEGITCSNPEPRELPPKILEGIVEPEKAIEIRPN